MSISECTNTGGMRDPSDKKYPPFSVVISVYGKDKAEWFDTALRSIISQTVKPDEIVLVIDGPVPGSIRSVIHKTAGVCRREGIRFQIIRFKTNQGLGMAMRAAVNAAENDIIAKMDSDDISRADRFEKQLSLMAGRPSLAVAGGQIEEFIDVPENKVGKRVVPCMDREIKQYLKKRCPFNHMTVMFRRQSVQQAGGYRSWLWNEDYYLWIRMALRSQEFANLPDTLVDVRVSRQMYERRGGIPYFRSEIGIQNLLLKKKLIGFPEYVMNSLGRLIVQVLLPGKIRGWVFRTAARQK